MCVCDGKRVNIPVPSFIRYHRWRDAVGYVSRLLDYGSSAEEEEAGKSTSSLTPGHEYGVFEQLKTEMTKFTLTRKAS
jgi:hypothetical protein